MWMSNMNIKSLFPHSRCLLLLRNEDYCNSVENSLNLSFKRQQTKRFAVFENLCCSIMLDFVIFAVVVVIFLFGLLFLLYPGKPKQPCNVPGPDPADEKTGNLPDIRDAGSLHEFLVQLHDDYGVVAGFWWGRNFVVSTADPDMFRNQINLFNKPKEIFEELYSLLLSANSLALLNDTDARTWRANLEKPFNPESCSTYFDTILKTAERVSSKWKSFDSEKHIPLKQFMLAMSLQSLLLCLFGDYFANDDQLFKFAKNIDICWLELEARLTESDSNLDDARMKKFERAKKELEDQIKECAKQRRETKSKTEGSLFIDELLKVPDDQLVSQSITYVLFGFQTAGNLISWLLYYIAKDDKIQEQIYDEIQTVIGSDKIKPTAVKDLTFIRQVIDETLRLSALIPWTARYSPVELKMGAFLVPKETPIIQALGVVCHNEHHWKDPLNFDPSRFDADNLKRTDSLCYPYFGFAGKRKCPANNFVYFQTTIFVAVLAKHFRISLVESDLIAIPVFGLVTSPEDEIYLTVEPRE